MRYVVIFNISQHVFDEAVMQHLRDGWELQGGVSICIHNGTIHFAQAMVRQEE